MNDNELRELANVLEQIRTKSRTTVVRGEDCYFLVGKFFGKLVIRNARGDAESLSLV